MDQQIVLVSNMCSEIMGESHAIVDPKQLMRPFKDLQEYMYANYLLFSDEHRIYWRYSPDQYFEIFDYMSYMTAVILSVEKTCYFLMNDRPDGWTENGKYLETLAYADKRRKERNYRNYYDVVIRRPGEPVSEDEDEKLIEESSRVIGQKCRTDSEIITFAVRDRPKTKYLTADCIPQRDLIEAIKKGYSTPKRVLTRPLEEVIERADLNKKGKNDKAEARSQKGKNSKSK